MTLDKEDKKMLSMWVCSLLCNSCDSNIQHLDVEKHQPSGNS